MTPDHDDQSDASELAADVEPAYTSETEATEKPMSEDGTPSDGMADREGDVVSGRVTDCEDGAVSDGEGDRDVEVPMRVYKSITVFTTMFAILTVVIGFVLLDSATNRATASLSDIQPLAALAGIGLIVVGAAAYAFSTRFRAEGMGKSKDDTDE